MQQLKAKLVVEGANIPVTHRGAEKYLHEQGVLCIPDFIANSGWRDLRRHGIPGQDRKRSHGSY